MGDGTRALSEARGSPGLARARHARSVAENPFDPTGSVPLEARDWKAKRLPPPLPLLRLDLQHPQVGWAGRAAPCPGVEEEAVGPPS
jgi:hypothetical protein